MDKLYVSLIANKQKAIAGFIVTFVATYVAQYGLDIQSLTLAQFIEQVVYGLIAYVGVYLKRNKS